MKYKIFNFLNWLDRVTSPTCEKCNIGKVRVERIDYINTHEYIVYKCDHCKVEFI